MARVVYVDDTLRQPGVPGPSQGTAHTLWVESAVGVETVAYDVVPQGVLAHDHGERRGTPLELPLFQVVLGPQGEAGDTPDQWTQGIPLYPPTSGSFVTNPKCLLYHHVFLPAGVRSFYVDACLYLNGASPRSVSLSAVLRPLYEVGRALGSGQGITATCTATHTGSVRASRAHFEFTGLEALGEVGLDRDDLILEVWLTSDPPVGTLYRLLSLTGYRDPTTATTTTSSAEPVESYEGRAQVDPADVVAGQVVTSQLVLRAHLRLNQATYAALGGTPGLESNTSVVRDSDSWKRTVTSRHRHYGRDFTDPDTGLRMSDGSVVRRSLWAGCFADSFGDSATQMGALPSSGYKLTPGASAEPNNGHLELRGRLQIPVGLRALLLRFGVSPGHNGAQGRLYFTFQLFDLDGTELDVSYSLNAGAQVDLDGRGEAVLVEPEEGCLWQPSSALQGAGIGRWTQRARRSPLPADVPNYTQVPRISKRVRVSFTPVRTQAYEFLATWRLESGALESGTYAGGAALAFFDAYAPAGF